jgi:hypothetical protein
LCFLSRKDPNSMESKLAPRAQSNSQHLHVIICHIKKCPIKFN